MRTPWLVTGIATLAAAALIAVASGREPLRADPHASDDATQPASASAPAATLLDRLPGSWNGEQKAGSVLLLESARWQSVLGGQFLEGTIDTSDPITGKVVYQARALLRVAQGRATLHWFDSNGDARRYEGAQDGDSLVLAREALEGRESVTIAKDGDGVKITFVRGAAAGRPEARVESTYKRVIERASGKKKKSKNADGG